MNKLLLLILVCLFWVFETKATTHASPSCEAKDVQNAIDDPLTKNGDTVTVPVGNCKWSEPVTLSKAITLQGSGINKTIITGYASAESGVLVINANSSLNTTIIGFTFNNAASHHICPSLAQMDNLIMLVQLELLEISSTQKVIQ